MVTPGGDIQAAINSLPAAGGCVCLKAGTHVIPQGLVIARNNVKLTGEGYGTIVRSQQPGPVLTIAGTAIEGIDISMIAFERVLATAPEGAAALAAVVAASGIRRSAITDCRVRATPPQQSIGIQAANTQEFRIARCRIEIGRDRDLCFRP